MIGRRGSKVESTSKKRRVGRERRTIGKTVGWE